MTSLVVAPEVAEKRTPVEVISLISHWSGGVASIRVPVEKIRTGSFTENGVEQTYIQFARPIKGNGERGDLINLFVHGKKPEQYCGKTVVAEIEIMHKLLADGREYYHIDLHLAPEDTQVTDRLVIVHVDDLPAEIPKGWVVLRTPPPVNGAIILMPPGTKMPPAKVAVCRTPTKSHAIVPTGNPTADRMIAAHGWNFDSETFIKIVLWKNKGGVRVTTEVLKPKKKK